MGIFYGLPEQEKEMDEAFCRQLEAASQQQFVWGMLTTLASSGESTQQSTNHP